INFGRAKELAVGSKYRTYIIAPDDIKFPHWIRLGKWAAKIKVEIIKIPDWAIQNKSGTYICNHPLNPLDLSINTNLLLYNRIVMPPVSLVSQSQLSGEYLTSNFIKSNNESNNKADNNWENLKQQYPELPNQLTLPKGAFYGARNAIAA
ncbi:MAG: type I-D CRISPR-associated protein Cas5/Csc1, partial [Cyanobacteria bacterium J06641_2]